MPWRVRSPNTSSLLTGACCRCRAVGSTDDPCSILAYGLGREASRSRIGGQADGRREEGIMLEIFARIDTQLFLWIHETWRSPESDAFFLWLTQLRHFLWPLALAWVLLLIFGGRSGRWIAIGLVFCLLATDQVSSQLIKPWVDRVRPCFAIEGVTALLPQAHSPSFPSAHATNAFGVAGLVLRARGGRWWWLLIVAMLIGLSRVIVGVHYPGDVAGGALLGLLLGALVWQIVSLFEQATSGERPRPSAPRERGRS
ncbi:MAG: phosphatase PAP2 family protein [Candidatus Eisenbacteria bacterium]|nr:phosphatase PAP2 family protein [Candidatus Eisenbacteria bacterium]